MQLSSRKARLRGDASLLFSLFDAGTSRRPLRVGLWAAVSALALSACSGSGDAEPAPGPGITTGGGTGTTQESTTQGATTTSGGGAASTSTSGGAGATSAGTGGEATSSGGAVGTSGATGGDAVTSTSGAPQDAGSAPGEVDAGFVEATCGEGDNPESGLQGDRYDGTVNCGLTLLSELPVGGHAQGSGHCAYVRVGGALPYTGSVIKAYSLTDPLNPVETDEEPAIGGSESMRAKTVDDRAVLVSGSGVYDVSDCEDMVKKGEIAWPSQFAQLGLYFGALSSHEIALSHDARRVYSGLGFAVADISDLERPDTWTVKNWSCEMNEQSNFPGDVPDSCDGPTQQDAGRQYSHSSDDNLEGTVWYGANQEGSGSQMEPSTARMVDISDPTRIEILDTLHEFPGHSMNWWRTPDGRDFIMGANEGPGAADSCMDYPRPKNLGNALDAYVVEVTGNTFGEPFPVTLDINRPENCDAAKASRGATSISEHSVFNEGGAAFVMIEWGSAGLRVFDLRDGENPREVAYYNDGNGHVHSGVFHYDAERGIMLASGSRAAQVLMLQPQIIAALGLPYPTDPGYPYK